MTHKDIYTKFVIEYDKANVTSSYPSLTEYEIATVLDKAYNALIAQKITGNNYRRSMFESDVKSIADLEPLVKSEKKRLSSENSRVANMSYTDCPNDMLYYITSYVRKDTKAMPVQSPYNPMDNNNTRTMQVKLVSHDMANNFFASPHNIPWVKDPVCYIESNKINVVYDPIDKPMFADADDETDTDIEIVYIKQPHTFVKDLSQYSSANYASYFDWNGSGNLPEAYQFECNSTMAEELVSLAVAFALENVESARLNSKLNMRGLEA